MSIKLNRNLTIMSALVVSALSMASSASAAFLPQPPQTRPIKCTCMGRYVPPRLCPIIHCPDVSMDTTMVGDRRPSTEVADIQLPPIHTQDLIAGRYRTQAPGGGIPRSADV